jgi:hypothetical protein
MLNRFTEANLEIPHREKYWVKTEGVVITPLESEG